MYHDYIVLTSHLAIRDTKTPPPLLAHYHMTRPTRNLIIYIAGPNHFFSLSFEYFICFICPNFK